MRNFRILAVVLAVGTLAGCAGMGGQPTTAEEYRKGVREAGAMMPVKLESYTVNRSHRAVTRLFKRNAKKCLAVTIRTTTRHGYNVQTHDTTYNPRVRVKGDRTELSIRMIPSGGIQLQTPPPGGYFMMVVDAIRVGRNRTRIDMYRPTIGHSAMIDGIRSWTKGRSRGCPDLTKSGL